MSTSDREKPKLTLGRALRSFRKCEEFSQDKMAEILGVSKTNLSDIERGARTVSLKKALDFARRLGASQSVYAELALQRLLDDEGIDFDVRLVRRSSTKASEVRVEDIDPRVREAQEIGAEPDRPESATG